MEIRDRDRLRPPEAPGMSRDTYRAFSLRDVMLIRRWGIFDAIISTRKAPSWLPCTLQRDKQGSWRRIFYPEQRCQISNHRGRGHCP